MPLRFVASLATILFLFVASSVATRSAFSADTSIQHRVLIQGNGKLAVVEPDGQISWEMPWGGIHDLHVLPNGNYLTLKDANKVVEIDPQTKQVLWQYDAGKRNGNQGKRIEIHAAEMIASDRFMVAESGAARIIEIDRDGNLLKEIPLVVDHPHPHTDTRLVRRIKNGNYLVAHEADGTAREYDHETGKVVWEYEVPMFGKQAKPGHGPEAFGNRLFAAIRRPNGNTLIATGNGHGVMEVTPDKQIVWQIHQNDLPSIRLAWVTTLELLENGNIVLGNCHAGPNQPQLVEVDPATNKVVWAFERFEEFGNNVSNTLLLDQQTTTTR
ncbi:putative secreted protein [Rhodopirellula maiorica SM1]|uniref:Putative secreted protein n=1 Tax=Rhodopirellula maiorica SM1 TaxID=1265738 RepID=M5RLW3_9BACT|nr:PQQ-binding-like beta-propeller repeat protein [Rhodopirellula maiorica]EMI20298.1 putative secreted protein [Rhodopirellula maiorica SM1]